MNNDAFESCIHAFENMWRNVGPCDFVPFLNGVAHQSERKRLLHELICIDLELRWRAGERPLLNDYGARFEELGSLETWPAKVIAEEYRVRVQWGDRPSHEAFLTRFHPKVSHIRTELLAIDTELREEAVVVPIECSEIHPAPNSNLLAHDDFHLKRMIGAGRSGKVYESRQRSTNRSFANKFLRKSLLYRPEVVARFCSEAETVARLQHPQIVGIHGVGLTPAGSYFLVMDYVDGPNLDAIIQNGDILLTSVVVWMITLCDAIAHAHSQGVIHCDLKPANLLLDPVCGVRVTDFGLARSLTVATRGVTDVEGTAPFMAPEQVSRIWGRIDERTDVYGIGAVLFTLLTGRPPWGGHRRPDVLASVISATPVVASELIQLNLPPGLSAICQKCLAKPQAKRYQSVVDLRSDLQNVTA